MSQAAHVIAKCGGITALARMLGHRHPSTVQGWKQRGFIPARRHGEILAAARRHRIPLSPSDFLVPAAGEGAPDGTYGALTQLGRGGGIAASPAEAVLETVDNPHPGADYVVRFTAPEFTSVCPVTGQPDFAHLVIDYVPDRAILESKSLKLYLASFRNHAAFHEDCTLAIARRLTEAVRPRWLRMGGYWYPRGGIPIDVFYQTGAPPDGLWIPDPGVAPYRGRG